MSGGEALAGLPPSLGGVVSPRDATPPPAAEDDGEEIEEEDDDDEEGEPTGDSAARGLSVDDMAPLCADMYADAFGALGSMYVGYAVELPNERAARRGKQLAVVLKKAGWNDDEVLAMVGLTIGIAGDFQILRAEKAQAEAAVADDAAAPGPEPGAAS